MRASYDCDVLPLCAPQFTGKERDAETGLDYFVARYYGSNLGRFMTPDPQFVQSRMFGDPQSWNLYGYVRNNPLRFIDPTGEAIELIGTEEQRRKQLQALQNAAGSKAGKYLYDNVDKKTGRHFVGIYTNGPDGKGKDFSQINKVSSALSSIIKNEQIAQVHIVRSFDYLPASQEGILYLCRAQRG